MALKDIIQSKFKGNQTMIKQLSKPKLKTTFKIEM